MKNLIYIIFLFSFTLNSWAQDIFSCSHPELCRIINQIVHENKLSNIKTENLISITGDPHEYEPSIGEIKKLISAPLLITGPNELNPWIKKINFQRSKIHERKTISILLDKKDFLLYSNANGESLSHFWLYPKVYCSLKNKLELELVKLGHSIKLNNSCDSEKVENQLSKVLNKIKMPIILTHDALLPLFLNLAHNQKYPIVAIKGSGHHEEANPNSIKKMYQALSVSKVIWVIEMGINIPQNILNKARPSDIIIKIDTANGKENESFSIINELTQKLSPYSEIER